MKIQRRVFRSAICLAQTAFLVAGNGALVYAANTSTAGALDGFEKTIFGEIHSNLTENARLNDLELNLFGKTRSGNSSNRLAEISKALGGSKNDNLLLPAMAPQLDTSTGHLKDAPATSQSYDSTSDSTPATAAGDAEKETLRSAMQMYSQGRTDEAERQFRKVLSMNKNSVDAYYNLGVIAEAKGDLQGALNNYRSASRINPSDSDLVSAAAGVQSKLQDKVAADQRQRQVQQQAALEQQQQRKTDNLKQMISEAATAYKGGNFDKAISNLQHVSREAPNDADVLYALGQAYKGKGDLDRARTSFNNAIAIDPGNQLYKNAMTDLNRVASNASSSSPSSYDGGPAPAPRRGNRSGQLTSFTGNDSGYSGGNSTSNSGSVGQLTPFSGISQKNNNRLDDEFSNVTAGGTGSMSRSYSGGISSIGGLGGLGGLGSLGGIGVGMLGAGGLGSMLNGGVRYSPTYMTRGYSGNRGGGGGTRMIRRAAIGGLGGAAAGAVYSKMGRGGNMRSAAMKGALMGAALGLFSSGW